jgi:hypothetical protein
MGVCGDPMFMSMVIGSPETQGRANDLLLKHIFFSALNLTPSGFIDC